MKWFSGSVAEAISLVQSKKNIFVAYVEGTCEKSGMMSSVLNEKTVSDELEKDIFVSVKLEANSIGHKHLIETYNSVPVPSLFFFSHNGVPLNIVEGSIYDNAVEIKTAILEAAEYSRKNNCETEVSNSVARDKVLQVRRKQVEELINAKRSDAALKNSKRPAEEEEKEKKIEVGESEENKSKKENELKKLVEEREMERRAEALARKEILDKIAQDKAERAKKMQMNEIKPSTSSTRPSASNTQNKPQPSLSSNARIQFKLPTGESRTNVFPNDAKLKDIRSYIDSNLGLTSRNYQLTTLFPRREFTTADNESSLEELNLIPTGTLLILTKSSGSLNPRRENWFTFAREMVYDLLKSVNSLRMYLMGLIFPTPSAGTPPPQANPTQPQPRQAPPPRTYVRKSGNIHSLKDLRDGNDENNTWNGNSTQQM